MSNGKNEKGKQYSNFFVFKKNKRGEYQRRMLQVDTGNKLIRNVKNFREKEQQRYKFTDLKQATIDASNPLELTLLFNHLPPLQIYMHTLLQKIDLLNLLNEIIKCTESNQDVQLGTGTTDILKEGPASYKKKTIGWDQRYLSLYPLYLHVSQQDTSDISRHVINLFATPISKEGERLICIHSTLQPYTFKFESSATRNEWFEVLLKASVDGQDDVRSRAYSYVVEKEETLKEIESFKTSISKAQADIERALEEQKEETAQLHRLEARCIELEVSIQKQQQVQSETEELLKETEAKYKSSHDELDSLVQTHKKSAEEVATWTRQLKLVQNSVTQLDASINDMGKLPEELELQIQELNSTIQMNAEQIKEEERILSEVTETDKELDEKLKEVEKKRAETAQTHEEALTTHQALKSAVQSQTQAVEAKRAEVKQLLAQYQTLQAKIQSYNEQHVEVIAQTESIQRQLAAMQLSSI